MSTACFTSAARVLVGGVGLLDLLSGLLLVVLPAWTLQRMFITPPAEEAALTYVAFVGAMVAGLGASYTFAAVWPAQGRRLRALLQLSLPVRAAIAGFVLWALFRGALGQGWWLVAGVDAALVVAQAVLLAKGAGRES